MTDRPSTPRSGLAAGDAPDWEAIARHFAGESSAAESAAVREWLEANPAEARTLDAIGAAAGRSAATARAGVDVEGALSRVHGRMYHDDAAVVPLRAKKRAHSNFWLSRGLAAAAAIVVLVGIATYRQLRERSAPAADRTYATGVGQRDSVTLGDGSTVVLAAASRLTVPGTFARGARRVRLEGEALFRVTHDEARPFTVEAGDATITDIGTTFTIRREASTGVTVAVTEGAVRVATPTDAGLDLNAGDAATVDTGGRVTARAGGATDADAAWTAGRLVFRDAPLSRVQADLARWYGVRLVIPDPGLVQRRLTATFSGDSRRQVLDVIAMSLGAHYELRGDTATLRSGPASRAR